MAIPIEKKLPNPIVMTILINGRSLKEVAPTRRSMVQAIPVNNKEPLKTVVSYLLSVGTF